MNTPYPNDNQATNTTLTFPKLAITQADIDKLSVKPQPEDPGFVVSDTSGNWEWFPNSFDCYHEQKLGTLENLAIYPAFDVSPLFRGFAHDVKWDSKTHSWQDLGPVPSN